MTKTQMTTKTAVQYNSSGAAAGFGPEPHPPHQDPSAANTIQDKTKGNSSFHSDNAAFIKKLKEVNYGGRNRYFCWSFKT